VAVIEGQLPDLADGEQVIYPDYTSSYSYKSNMENPLVKKVVESSGSINYKTATISNPLQFRNYRIEYTDRVHFSVCDGLMKESLQSASASTKMTTKRLFVSYTNSDDGQIRFSSANFMRSSDSQEPNPCESNDCSIYAECVVDSEADIGYYCQCKPGFDGDGKDCSDINECEEGSAYCSPVAQCQNLLGYFDCKCAAPRVGDGRTCEWGPDTRANEICSRCDVNARCVTDDTGSTAECQCNAGYRGNGYDCRLGKRFGLVCETLVLYFLFESK
jgi:hypothetical protein